ncbi:DUF4019 domain-containing protein [Pseudoxanthomonas dokdonensis]|uniref:DUF4019 domain-containing protein n=1 Tax=Pseudoxanthomonas dokdonensis TaxID=344882 RepID=UPI0014777609|nr:DUF4019 domain-containing protein [Pseudoxanthomonas dokdonensis]
MKQRLAGLLLLLLMTLPGCTVSFNPSANQDLPEPTSGNREQQLEAEQAARMYLQMIDRKQFEKTWRMAGSALRDQSSEFAWVNMLKLASKTFGTPQQRTLEGFGFSPRIDVNVPPGEYVLVQFKDSAGKVTVTEKVVMQREQASWKLIGYFINKRVQYGADA